MKRWREMFYARSTAWAKAVGWKLKGLRKRASAPGALGRVGHSRQHCRPFLWISVSILREAREALLFLSSGGCVSQPSKFCRFRAAGS